MHAVCLKGVYWETNFPKFRPDRTKTLTKLKPNEIFNDFAISWVAINEIEPDLFYFKDMDQKLTPNPIAPDHTKFVEVGAE